MLITGPGVTFNKKWKEKAMKIIDQISLGFCFASMVIDIIKYQFLDEIFLDL